MLFFPNAKINIGLNIVSKRSDGYHNIETIFCPVGLSDMLEIVTSDGGTSGRVTLSITGITVDGPIEHNLCVRAWQLLNNDFHLPSTAIHLHKIIPPGAGLGGGSSDAAFMLKNMNTFFDLHLSEQDLCHYASRLGSDCAFFIKNRPLFGHERGNVFKELAHFPQNLEIAVVNPGIHISTADAYAGVKPELPGVSLEKLILLPVEQWKDRIFNDFENTVFQNHPFIGTIKEKMYGLGAVYASMSGSGSSVYGLFKGTTPEMKLHFPGLFSWTGHL